MNVKKQQFAILWWKNPTYPKLTKTGQKQAMIYNPLAHVFLFSHYYYLCVLFTSVA